MDTKDTRVSTFTRRRLLLATGVGVPCIAYLENSASASALVAARWFFQGAIGSAVRFIGAAAMRWLINWWFQHPPRLPNQPPPGWVPAQPPGFVVPSAPMPWGTFGAHPNWKLVWPQVSPVLPPTFQPPPEFISLWISTETSQIYEIRAVGPYFLVSSLNDQVSPQLVGGGVINSWRFHFQALGPKPGPFSIGAADVFIDTNGLHWLVGGTATPGPVAWEPRFTIRWRRLR